MHTIWVRYHNYLVEQLTEINPHWGAEQLYEEARMIVSALHQKITFYDYLPLIIGDSGAAALAPYQFTAGYDPNIDATIANVFRFKKSYKK